MQDRIDRARALLAEGRALFGEGRLEAAEGRFRASAELALSVSALHNIGTVRQLLGDYEGAEAWHRQALGHDAANPRVRASLGLALLGQGRYAEGFELYDAWRETAERRGKSAPQIASAPLWRGEPVEGRKLLIWPEEGFGDQIMYARFTPQLLAEGARLAWYCNPAMTQLLAEGLGVQAVPTDAKGSFQVDYIVPSSRLPMVFMRRLGAPPPAPYLKPPAPNVIAGLTLGIVARGNPAHDNDRNRSLPAAAAAELMALPGAVSLAPEDTGARHFHDTAGVIAGLDLVISVDSAIAHLAGALGKPVWVLLPAIGTDWRWLRGRADTPWYPTMRLFRQQTPGDWRPVLEAVRAALAAR